MPVQIFDEDGISDFFDADNASGFTDQDGDFFATSAGDGEGEAVLMPMGCM